MKFLKEDWLDEVSTGEDIFPHLVTAIYTAIKIVENLVHDERTAESLYMWALRHGWYQTELVALGELIAHALECNGIDGDVINTYKPPKPYFPIHWVLRASSNDTQVAEDLINKCVTSMHLKRLLFLAVNSVVLEID